jgi:1-acyl-sn-glycerol-3-phosphate acyltransferase
MKTRLQAVAVDTTREFSPRLLHFFMMYLEWYVPRHFHSLRVANAERFPADARPLIACINHASWWDPLIILMLAKHLAPARIAFAPMEAEALSHYGFFRKIGAFAVDNTSPRAGGQFLRQAKQVLSQPKAILWTTPEGRFTDVRQRPIDWKLGTASLTRELGRRGGDCTVVPVAIEYTFWDERLPEVLCSIGEPLFFPASDHQTTAVRNRQLQEAMTATQNELASRAMKRDGALFTSIFSGSAGVGATYDLWQRVKSAMSGRPYAAEHAAILEQRDAK